MSKKDWTWASSNRHGYRGGKMAENIDDDDMDDGYDSYEEYNGEEDEEWYEEEEQQEGAKEGEKKHVDPTPTGGGAALSDFITTKKKDKPAPTQPANPAADPESLLSKEEADKMRDDLLQHGVQSKNIPKAHAALKQMHEGIIGGETAALEKHKQRFINGQGKAIEEFPEEIWDHVIELLEFKSILSLSATCTWLKYMASCAASLPRNFVVSAQCSMEQIGPPPPKPGLTAWEVASHTRRNEANFFHRPKSKVVLYFFKHSQKDSVEPLFPWNVFDSIRYEIARAQQLHWQTHLDRFSSTIERCEQQGPLTLDEKTGKYKYEVVTVEKFPEKNRERRRLIEERLAECEQAALRIRAGVWMDVFNGLDLSTAALQIASNTTTELCGGHTVEDAQRSDEASVDPKHSALHAYCRIKANEAAGMFNVAHKLAEAAVEHKAWQMRDAGSLLAKNIGVPTSEAAWVALARQLSTASLDSDEANEDDVTLRENAQRSGPLFKPRDYHSPAVSFKSASQGLKEEPVKKEIRVWTPSNWRGGPEKTKAEVEKELKASMTASQWRLRKQMMNSA